MSRLYFFVLMLCIPYRADAEYEVLVIHGLNNRPEAFEPLARALAMRGFTPRIVPLAGHQPRDSLRGVAATRWIRDISDAYREFAPPPRRVVAFSAGAAALLHAMQQDPHIQFDRAVLLAPAIRFTWRVLPVRLLFPLGFFGLSLPSQVPRQFRAHTFTPISAFRETIRLGDTLRGDGLEQLPVRVILSPDDELVSLRKVKAWAEREGFDRWEFVEPPKHGGYEHLMFSPESYSPEGWNDLVSQIVEFLQSDDAELKQRG